MGSPLVLVTCGYAFLRGQVSLCSPGWPLFLYADHTSFEPTEIHLSPVEYEELKVCDTKSSLDMHKKNSLKIFLSRPQ